MEPLVVEIDSRSWPTWCCLPWSWSHNFLSGSWASFPSFLRSSIFVSSSWTATRASCNFCSLPCNLDASICMACVGSSPKTPSPATLPRTAPVAPTTVPSASSAVAAPAARPPPATAARSVGSGTTTPRGPMRANLAVTLAMPTPALMVCIFRRWSASFFAAVAAWASSRSRVLISSSTSLVSSSRRARRTLVWLMMPWICFFCATDKFESPFADSRAVSPSVSISSDPWTRLSH
mmetsp:Transcript_19704/g.60958  ORF Transcript_19704/g.60958 Transcript_19704/m.60958 type:complete len:235 (-) Transcript_19704:710-1414(-)